MLYYSRREVKIVVKKQDTIKPFSDMLKESRKRQKKTQTELAKQVGISAMSVSRYESGDSIPDIGILGSICVALKDDALFDSWNHSRQKFNAIEGDKTTKTVHEQKQEFRTIKSIAARQYLSMLVTNGSKQFLDLLDDMIKKLQGMNEAGVKQAISIVDIIRKVPEYQSNGYWTLRDNLKEGDDSENELHVGNIDWGETISTESE